MLGVRINIRYDQKNGHTRHKVKCQLVIFMFVFIEENKINNSQEHVREP